MQPLLTSGSNEAKIAASLQRREQLENWVSGLDQKVQIDFIRTLSSTALYQEVWSYLEHYVGLTSNRTGVFNLKYLSSNKHTAVSSKSPEHALFEFSVCLEGKRWA